MALKEWFEGWLLSKALKKAAITLAQGVGSYLLAHSGVLNGWGVNVSIDPNLLSGAFLAVSEVLRNWLKQKMGATWL